MDFESLTVEEQLAEWTRRATDERARVATGWSDLDGLLYRGGFGPSTFVILGGRTGTRKTTLALNLAANMLGAGHRVGMLGLDEDVGNYVAKLASVISGVPHEWLEDHWGDPAAERARTLYRTMAANFVLSRGYRPSIERLDGWWEMADRPKVVIIDYLTEMDHSGFGSKLDRVVALADSLHVWTKEHETITIALHQVGRFQDGSNREHGHTPVTAAQLRYAGEEIADVVLATYRPDLDPLGNADETEARAMMGKNFDEEMYTDAVARVRRYHRSTFVQLLKNRPGTRFNFRGIELISDSEALTMRPLTEKARQSIAPSN